MGFFDFLSKKKDSGEAPGAGPDFSGVDAEKAGELARQGVLAPLYMMPLRFGGEESARNCLFVPPVVVALKDRCDDMVEDLLRQEKVNGYQCLPEYQLFLFYQICICFSADQFPSVYIEYPSVFPEILSWNMVRNR